MHILQENNRFLVYDFSIFGGGGSLKACESVIPKPQTIHYQIEEDANRTITLDIEGGEEPYTVNVIGDDADKFNISGFTLTTKEPLDFESPIDSNMDNVYELDVVVFDANKVGSITHIIIEVLDVTGDNVVVRNPEQYTDFSTVFINKDIGDGLYKFEYYRDGAYVANNSPTDIPLVGSNNNIPAKGFSSFTNNTDSAKEIILGYSNLPNQIVDTKLKSSNISYIHLYSDTNICLDDNCGVDFDIVGSYIDDTVEYTTIDNTNTTKINITGDEDIEFTVEGGGVGSLLVIEVGNNAFDVYQNSDNTTIAEGVNSWEVNPDDNLRFKITI